MNKSLENEKNDSIYLLLYFKILQKIYPNVNIKQLIKVQFFHQEVQ